MTTLRSSQETSVEVPLAYSRQKAMQLVKGKGNPVPHSKATDLLYIMFMKIGAINELPSDERLKESYLNDFWVTFYFDNHSCPGDIPFHIIVNQFIREMVQGRIERKGNNQAAICQAFNKWVTRDDVRARLYQKRDEMYPNAKPKQIPKNATEETVQDYSDQELVQKYKSIKPMAGLKMVDQMLEKLEEEAETRNLKLQSDVE
jgi:hypothetical protein